MFKKARHNRVFEDVIQQVETAILNGDLKPGDRLPSERDLQKIMDIGRGTLRESLRVLEQKGLIEIKPGAKGGIFVKAITAGQMGDSLDLIMRSKQVSPDHLSEYRADVESLIAGRAAENSTIAEVAALRELLSDMESQLLAEPPDWDGFFQTDKNMHLALAKMAGNPLHYYFLDIVHDMVHRYRLKTFLPKDQGTRDIEISDMNALVDAVSDGNSIRAQEIARRHVLRFNELAETARRKLHREP